MGRADVHTSAAALLAAAKEAVEGGTVIPWQRVAVVNGAPAVDCAPMLTVHVPDMGPSSVATTGGASAVSELFRAGHDHSLWTVSYVITFADCYPDKASPITDADLDAAAQEAYAAAWAIQNHLNRLLMEGWALGGVCQGFQFGRAIPLPPQGRMHGFVIPCESQLDGYNTSEEWS